MCMCKRCFSSAPLPLLSVRCISSITALHNRPTFFLKKKKNILTWSCERMRRFPSISLLYTPPRGANWHLSMWGSFSFFLFSPWTHQCYARLPCSSSWGRGEKGIEKIGDVCLRVYRYSNRGLYFPFSPSVPLPITMLMLFSFFLLFLLGLLPHFFFFACFFFFFFSILMILLYLMGRIDCFWWSFRCLMRCAVL
ncbi:unnamed protein product [Trypanosoma congolense IL3000]|uniref:WGS project CAEQ00000000 data, annotated contig 730 n=1 Tax=Trypanosoma congolense (strain IL3000) TaxID=1068625 RepID=F9WI44_TRYCI|nr:unnamed protein product [Trypanosoma congolense IL3000]